jgi:hypothetical protein
VCGTLNNCEDLSIDGLPKKQIKPKLRITNPKAKAKTRLLLQMYKINSNNPMRFWSARIAPI